MRPLLRILRSRHLHIPVRRPLLRILIAILLFALAGAATAHEPRPFRDAAEEQRFQALVADLRCVMCQNEPLSSSKALIARDMRGKVFELMQQGQSDAQIKQFLVDRYGEFVLYRTPLSPGTWLLWFGPALVLVGGALTVLLIVRRRAKQAAPVASPENEQEW